MQIDKIKNYYNSQGKTAALLLLWGVASFALGVYLYQYCVDIFWNGMSYSVLLMALVQIGLASYLLWQASRKKKALTKQSEDFSLREEIANIPSRQKDLRQRNATQQTLLVISIALILVGIFWHELKPFAVGSGLGLLVQTSFVYLIDIVSLWRTDLYASELKT